jgi:hypothetical protein
MEKICCEKVVSVPVKIYNYSGLARNERAFRKEKSQKLELFQRYSSAFSGQK